MSGMAHLPGAPDATASQVPHFTQQPGALHIAVPVITPTWPDSTATAPVPVPSSTQTYYLTNPSTVVPSLPREQKHVDAPAPRPRKPYTTTKVREMWTPSEHERMLEGLRLYKRDWAKVTSFVGTRSAAQVRSHAQKYFDRVARDKTDEYVPRARPKRKSSTPYPRKVREDLGKAQPSQQTYRAPIATPYQIPVVQPSTASFEMQPVAFASPHLHHPVRIAPGQSPILSHVPTSPYVTQPQHVNGPVAVPHRVYSPFMEMSSTSNPNPHRSNVHPSPEIQASPLSYVSGQTYATHSPSIAQQTISIPTTPMYGVLSPITPGTFGYSSRRTSSMTHTPVTMYGQPGVVQTNMALAAPRHSHPEGPLENCAKCNALQRYGAVLQEIGELNHANGQPELQTGNGSGAHGSSREMNNTTPTTDPSQGTFLPRNNSRRRTGHGNNNRQAPSSGSASPQKKSLDTPSPACSDEGIECGTHTAHAGNRANRAKIMRARKLKQRSSSRKERRSNLRGECEDQSESTNSTPENHRRTPQGKDLNLHAKSSSMRQNGAVSKKRKMPSQRDRERDNGEPEKKQRNAPQSKERKRGSGQDLKQGQKAGEGNLPKSKHKQTGRDRQNRLPAPKRGLSEDAATNRDHSPSSKIDESEAGPRSPTVETYTPRERMELFDAVHSLQILAKTSSSSGSPSPRSGGDPRKSDEEQ